MKNNKPGTYIKKIGQRIQPCRHISHNPPSHIVIPPDSFMEHTCPGCGRTVVVYPSSVLMKLGAGVLSRVPKSSGQSTTAD